jgi:hypothetical protein
MHNRILLHIAHIHQSHKTITKKTKENTILSNCPEQTRTQEHNKNTNHTLPMHILHLQLNEGSKYVIPITLSKHVTHLPPRKGNKYAIPITLSEHVSHLQPRKGSKYAIPVILSKHVSHLYSSKGNKHAIPITLSYYPLRSTK